jgi:hypothetical protein
MAEAITEAEADEMDEMADATGLERHEPGRGTRLQNGAETGSTRATFTIEGDRAQDARAGDILREKQPMSLNQHEREGRRDMSNMSTN